jgi:hypothetical protein
VRDRGKEKNINDKSWDDLLSKNDSLDNELNASKLSMSKLRLGKEKEHKHHHHHKKKDSEYKEEKEEEND